MNEKIAKIAVSAATYWIDKPYDYLIPEEFAGKVCAGMRVFVPFGKGNRRSEGILLGVYDRSEYDALKPITALPDDAPVLSDEQIRLALFMRERFFCTVYDAVKAMLPAGLWFDDEGGRRIGDKTVEMARLAVATEDAMDFAEKKRRRSRQQAAIIDMLCGFEAVPSTELLKFAGAKRQALKALEKAEIVELYRREVYRRPEVFAGETDPLPVLNREQSEAFEGISELAESGKTAAALLQGVTGSGKTSVYVHLIRRQIERGKASILLVPEIALTPQMIKTFSSYFGDDIAVLHSSLSTGERYDEWKRIKAGKARVIIGTRSAVFAPAASLGLIIIDEEQEETYKSENNPRYDAREVAKFRCAKAGCLLLLGSATPEVVSRYKADTGKYAFFRLDSRYNDMRLPAVTVVDMKRELRRGNSGAISTFLRDEIQKNIENGEQCILFINRRGTSKLITCRECGYTYKCPRCSVSLTYHGSNDRLMCHYCGYSKRIDRVCPDCGGELSFSGAGTQAVVDELEGLFPGVEVLRMDTDSVAPVGSHEELFKKFREKKIPIMVGTQMVTKGLNFEDVTLVGVILADQSLYAGDYRAGERTFSLLTQVIGRSGRGKKEGRAVIQTFTPENETILNSAAQDYEAFYRSEIELRKLQNAPPYMQFYSVTVTGADEELTVRCGKYIRSFFDVVLKGRNDVVILGPAPLPVVRVNNRYRYRVNISCTNEKEMRAFISRIVMECSCDKRFRGVSVYADANPLE